MFALLEKHITDKTKAVIINAPNNPTGLVYSKKCIQDVADLLRKYPNIWIIGDDIYDQLYFSQRITLITEVAPDLADRYVIVNGVSKSFAMTGWRVGYTIAPKFLNDAIKTVSFANCYMWLLYFPICIYYCNEYES